MSRNEENGRRNSLELLGIEAAGTAAAERIIEIPVTAIRPNPHQPRREFPADSLKELADSIKEHGLQQPIIVRETGRPAAPGGPEAGPAYELVCGERRLRAHQVVGIKAIRAVVRRIADEQMLRLAIVENVHREDLSLIDRAGAFCRLKDQFHAGKVEPTAEDLKISRRTGFNYTRIGEADPKYQALIVKHDLDVRGSNFLLSLAGKVEKDRPEDLETFEKELAATKVGFTELKRLHDAYFPPELPREESGVLGKEQKKAERPAEPKGPYWKTEKEAILELRYTLAEVPPIAPKLRVAWAKAATRFFRDAGFKVVDIQN